MWGLFRRIETGLGLVPMAGRPTVSAPTPVTGVVTGALGFTVPSGMPLTYGVANAPAHGTVTVADNGAFTYKPNTPTNAGQDSFTVTASTGLAATNQVVTVGAVGALHTTPPTYTVITSIGGISNPSFLMVSPDGTRVYVSGNSLSVIDTTTNTLTGNHNFAAGPATGAAVNPDGSKVYIANLFTRTVSVINTVTYAESNTIRLLSRDGVPVMPWGLAISADGGQVYVPTRAVSDLTPIPDDPLVLGSVSVIDTATNAVTAIVGVGNNPYGVAVSPDNRHVYVTNTGKTTLAGFGGGTVSVIDTATPVTLPDGSEGHAVTESNIIRIADSYPQEVAVSPSGEYLYVTSRKSMEDDPDSGVWVIKLAPDNNTVISTTKIPLANSYGVAVSPDGRYVYVTNYPGNTVSVIDTLTNNVAATIDVPDNPSVVAISPVTGFIYVSSIGNGDPSSPPSVSVISING